MMSVESGQRIIELITLNEETIIIIWLVFFSKFQFTPDEGKSVFRKLLINVNIFEFLE